MKIEKIINEAKKKQGIKSDDPVVQVPANALTQLFPLVNIKKAFFQAANPDGTGWRLYFVTEENEAIVLPVNPQVGIHLVTKQGLIDDITEFKQTAIAQKENLGKQLDAQQSDYNNFLGEIVKNEKGKKKTAKKKTAKKAGKLKRVK